VNVSENRLELVSKPLVALLAAASPNQCRRVARAVAEFAVIRSGLQDRLIREALVQLRTGLPDETMKTEIAALVESLDERYFDLQEAGRDPLAAFGRARAANAVLFAVDPDPFVAAAEAVYEASVATDDLPQLEQLVRTAVGQ
jgi:hypothetical protein